ncbi:hypothetical protein L1987_37590 [Smallanthus sonchifolius]|uniref:Uncharacterized protein n=1 Tax=Smallanthus sonchifolius TaxID=185202 RepID=A0ACB9HGC6_9ASTR|nr:hypothetical protein L1987_37590 [Smallanthus sonchifolius]
MANRAIAVVSKIEGTFTSSNRFLVPSKKAFSSLHLGLGFGPPASNSCSLYDHPRSMFENVRNLNEALYLFDEMLQTRPLPSGFHFTRLLDFITKIKHFSCSIDCFKQMWSVGVPVNKRIACIVIKCYARLHQTRHGFTVLGCCFKHADTWTCNTLVKGFIVEDKTHEAERLFKNLIRNHLCEPDLVTYNTMITGLCKIGNNFAAAIGLVRLMDGRGCKPNVDTHNIIIDALCKDLMIDDAFKLFKRIIIHNVVTYNSLIDALCNIKEAEVVIDIMYESFDMHVDTVTVNSLINVQCLRGEMGKALVHFNELGYVGIDPNADTYNIMLDGFCRDLKMREPQSALGNTYTYQDALAFFRFMDANGSNLNSHIEVYNVLIDGAIKCGKFDTARRLFHDLSVKGLQPDVRTYTMMISSFCRRGLLKDAKNCFLKWKRLRIALSEDI